MPFDRTIRNPRLIGEHFLVDYRGTDGKTAQASINLDSVLGHSDGKFKWGSYGFKAVAREISLSGSELTAELPYRDGWNEAKVDLSLHIRLRSGKLETFNIKIDSSPRSGSPVNNSPPTSLKRDTVSGQSTTLTRFKSSSQYRSSSFFKYSVSRDKLRLTGYILSAECLNRDGTYNSSTLDLKEYIGVVGGQLVWGRREFLKDCKSVKLDGYNLVAECIYEGATLESNLDLSRYLQSYNGTLGLKVAESTTELSGLFSEARWMKVKIITEPDASVVVKGGFRNAFNSIADSTSKDVIAEMTEDLAESVTLDIASTLGDNVKAAMTRVVTDTVTQEIRDALEKRVEDAFAEAKKTVLVACNEMIDQTVNKVTIECTESVIGPMSDAVTAQCKLAMANVISSVTSSAVEHFQERVEIMMEREIVSASIRRAQTKAAFLQMLENA